jgi:hypothetical protein
MKRVTERCEYLVAVIRLNSLGCYLLISQANEKLLCVCVSTLVRRSVLEMKTGVKAQLLGKPGIGHL